MNETNLHIFFFLSSMALIQQISGYIKKKNQMENLNPLQLQELEQHEAAFICAQLMFWEEGPASFMIRVLKLRIFPIQYL